MLGDSALPSQKKKNRSENSVWQISAILLQPQCDNTGKVRYVMMPTWPDHICQLYPHSGSAGCCNDNLRAISNDKVGIMTTLVLSVMTKLASWQLSVSNLLSSATNDVKVGIMTTLGIWPPFQYHQWWQSWHHDNSLFSVHDVVKCKAAAPPLIHQQCYASFTQ